jgi:hypothetical protein
VGLFLRFSRPLERTVHERFHYTGEQQMKIKILLAGLACLSVVAMAQGSNSEQKPVSKTGQVMLRESPSKASTGLRESPSKASTTTVRESPSKGTVKAADVDGDGRADRPIGSQSSGSGAGVAINNSHSNIKSPRDSATGQASGKVNVQDLSFTKRSKSSAAEEPKK